MNQDTTIEKRAGFTQGPWHVQLLSEPKKLPYAIFDNNIDVIARGHEERDARLIAQAPAMYEQCKFLERMLAQTDHHSSPKLAQLRELLAKVDGGER